MKDSDNCVLVRVSIIKTKALESATAPRQHQGLLQSLRKSVLNDTMRKRSSMFIGGSDDETELELDSVHAALAVHGRQPIRMVVNELLVCVRPS
jgi:hypothetical protein